MDTGKLCPKTNSLSIQSFVKKVKYIQTRHDISPYQCKLLCFRTIRTRRAVIRYNR